MFHIVNGALSGISSHIAPTQQKSHLPTVYQQWDRALSMSNTTQDSERLADMKLRHEEVVAHEEAHASVGGAYAGAPSYSFEIGPDGEGYAVAGEVPIDMSPIAGDPQGTYDKMLIVEAAALAPAQPSGQDMIVAGTAATLAMEASNEIFMMNSNMGETGGEDGFLDDVFKPSSIFGQPLFG